MGSGLESDSAGVWRGTETIEVITAFRLAAVLPVTTRSKATSRLEPALASPLACARTT
jgi:hypothetical protein